MGGNSSGVSSADVSRLTSAAEKRLKQIAEGGTRVLFACEVADRKALNSHLARTKVFDLSKSDVTDSSEDNRYQTLLPKASLVVVFTDAAEKCSFLDEVVELSFRERKQGVHSKAHDGSRIPSKATAYRWPSLLWEKLEEMFA